jgi:hypothetical protein
MVQQSTAVINAIAALLIWMACSNVIKRYPTIKTTSNKMTINKVFK